MEAKPPARPGNKKSPPPNQYRTEIRQKLSQPSKYEPASSFCQLLNAWKVLVIKWINKVDDSNGSPVFHRRRACLGLDHDYKMTIRSILSQYVYTYIHMIDGGCESHIEIFISGSWHCTKTKKRHLGIPDEWKFALGWNSYVLKYLWTLLLTRI